MGQFFTDDIDALLRSGHGDLSRLNKIKAEFASTKLVSLDDRKYVESLVSRYLQIPIDTPRQEKPIEEKTRIVPPPPPPRNPPTLLEVKQQKPKEKPIPKLDGKIKLRNVVIAVCAVVFAVLAVSFVAMNQDQDSGILTPSSGKNFEIDASSYVRGDVISISGKTTDSTSIVKLAITNPSGKEIWGETVTVKPSHAFSTLLIAGGDGWEQAGKYTVTVTYSGTTNSLSFDFNPAES